MCEQSLNKEYDERILELATALANKQAIDSNTSVCSQDYLKAKRYSKLLNYLSGSVCCPEDVKYEIISKLHLNSKL